MKATSFEAIYRIHQTEDNFYHETLHKKSLEPYFKRCGELFDVTEDNVVQCRKCPYTANMNSSKSKRKRSDFRGTGKIIKIRAIFSLFSFVPVAATLQSQEGPSP